MGQYLELASTVDVNKSTAKNSSCINPLNAEINLICHLLILLGDLTFMGHVMQFLFERLRFNMTGKFTSLFEFMQ
jgi:hypothetical protein